MKRLQLLFILLAFLILCAANASAQKMIDSLRFADRQWSLEKRAMVLQYMKLTEADKSSFWPLFERYQSATQYLEMEYIFMLSTYAKKHDSLSGTELDALLTGLLKDDLQLARIRKQYFKKFKKALSPVQATTFMHLDHTFRNMIRMEAQKGLPAMDAYYFASSARK